MPLAAAAIAWVTTLAAAVLPERNPYPSIYNALSATLEAICHAPSARGWRTYWSSTTHATASKS